MLSVSLLGDFCIEHDETPVRDVDTSRLQSLLAYLLLHRDAPQSRAHLAFLFWPDTAEAQARTNLRNLLHQLRHALPDADSYLVADTQTLQWRSNSPFALDVADFHAALALAQQVPQTNDSAALREALERAIALYKGELLPSCYDDWIIPEREALRQEYLIALERLAHLLEDRRDYEAAIAIAQRLLGHDPLHEVAYRRLIRLHALNGDRAGALQVYHTCATVLRRELDVEPSAATCQAYEQLLGAEQLPSPALPSTTAFSPTVGREIEWAHMLRAWRAVAAGGEPHAVMLRGEAGIGKTRLVEDLLQWTVRQGIPGSYARCYAAEGQLAYAPIAAWLRARPLPPLEDVWLAEVARLLPELLAHWPDLPRPVALTEAWQRQRLFEALSRAVLGADRPLLLTIDDLQWCDRDTLEWLHFLLRPGRQARLLLVGAYRPEEVGEGHPLLSLLQALRLEGQLTDIELRPLDEPATQTLAARIAGMEIGPAAARLLYRETEGNPLFVVETVRAGLPLQEPDAVALLKLPYEPLPGGAALPPQVRSVLEARLTQLSPPARELAELAATIGREFSFKLLATAGGGDEDTLVRRLDELWQRRIVREHGADAYDFCHDKLREVAYDGMSAARRRLLHRHAAQALESLYAADLDPVSRQLAAHYERAGLAEQAAPYYLRAAQVARRVYANEEAVTLLQRGLALLEDAGQGAHGGQPCPEVGVHLYEELGDVLALTGRRDGARQAYEQAMAGAPVANLVWRARLQRRIGTAWDEENRWQEAVQAYAAAEAALGPAPPDPAPEWWREWLEIQHRKIWLYYGLGRLDEMSVLADRCRPIVDRHATPLQRGQFFQGLSLLGFRQERYALSDETLAHARAALDAFRESGDAGAATLAVSGLGFALLWAGRLDEAEQTMLTALEQVERSGAVAVQSRVLTYLTVLYRMRGQVDQVKHFAARSLALATERQMFEYIGMSKASLAWLACREGDMPASEACGAAAVEMWQQAPLSTPFQWTARLPLLAASLGQNRLPDAAGHAQAMLHPEQQRLPPDLTMHLEQAVAAWQHEDHIEAAARLRQAIQLAQESGFL